jgi:N-acetylmuramoyl-L-alanine amidase
MTRTRSAHSHTGERILRIALAGWVSLAALASVAPSAHADKRTQAREQFEQAVKMRTMLEGYLVADRSLGDYKQTIAAYHKVYLISAQADDVTLALIAEGELYEEMGRLFDAKYFQSAIDSYDFLLTQYPGTRYRAQAIYAIGRIQKDDLNQPDKAEATLGEYVRRFPKGDKIADAKRALKEITDAREAAREAQAAARETAREAEIADAAVAKGPVVEPREAQNRTPFVTDIRTWNAESYTRIVVTLDDTVKYESARIKAPDRVYFDLYRARLAPVLAHKNIEVQNGLLKSVRVAQNKDGVVRLVLDVNGAQNFSAFLLAKPYRLVIDVHAQPAVTTKASAGSAAAAPASATAAPKNEPPRTTAKPAETIAVNADSPAVEPVKPAPKSTSSVKSPFAPPSAARGDTPKSSAALAPHSEAKPNRDGQRSLTRELGLKISRIVIDPGHGGRDTGTIGPHGLMEKDLCLDVALKLGHLIEEKIQGAEVVYTRHDDTFIPLEDRTAIANEAKADLFISIHANSSHDHQARGVETYYLNFATSQEAMEVATRENALSQESVHDLQDLVKKIARNEKIEESKELATDIQDSLAHRLQLVSQNQKNRGVKKAPFVVLIGANMPSVLSEISFISNPADEKLLKKPDQRQRVAEGLFRGISAYLENLNSLSYNKQKLVSDNHLPAVASNGNQK